jgi:hypothetical protein
MLMSEVVTAFRSRQPDLQISARVVNAREAREFFVARSDARGAQAGDPCNCTIARSCRRELEAPEAIVLLTTAYVLERRAAGDWHIMKYEHDGADVVRALDTYGVAIAHTRVQLRPPSRYRRVGAQTATQKAKLPGHKKQSAAHVAKRRASIMASPSRARRGRIQPT